MIDLHLHLDGSLPLKTMLALAAAQNIPLPADTEAGLRSYCQASADCADLQDYLRCFALPLSLLQTPTALEQAVFDVCSELSQQGIVYAELRFAPQLHTDCGMTQTDAVNAARRGLARSPIFCELILCCMRGANNRPANLETIRLAHEFHGRGICAADLAGDETRYPTDDFADVFALAKKLEVPFTIHAGEAAGADSIAAAMDMGAARIGHGITLIQDAALLQTVIERGIPLEMCPSSNLHTHAVPGMKEHPLLRLLRQGVRVCVGTDNMTVSGTTLAREFALLTRCGMTTAEHRQLLQNAADAAFLLPFQKERLREQLKMTSL